MTEKILIGKRILLTRPEHQSAEMAEKLRALGAEVIFQPAIFIAPPKEDGPMREAVRNLKAYDWAVFSSVNGVRFFMRTLMEMLAADSGTTAGNEAKRSDRIEVKNRSEELSGHSASAPFPAVVSKFTGVKIAAIGPGTAAALEDFSLKADMVPAVFCADEMATMLTTETTAGNEAKRSDRIAPENRSEELSGHSASAPFPAVVSKKFLLIRASRGREILAETLVAAGAEVTQVTAYTSEDVTRESPLWNPEILAEMNAGRIHFTTVTSSAIAAALVNLFGDALHKTKLVSISPITSATLTKLGFPPTLEAKDATMEGIIEVIRNS